MGSEMCIRDSGDTALRGAWVPSPPIVDAFHLGDGQVAGDVPEKIAVLTVRAGLQMDFPVLRG